MHRAALAGVTSGCDRSGREQRSCFCLHGDAAALWPAGCRDAARLQRHVFDGPEDDLAVFAHHRRVGVGHAAVFHQRAIHADAPAGSDQLAEIDRLIVGGGDLHPHFRGLRIHQFDTLARGEDDLALRAADDAAVLYVLADQIHHAAGGRIDRALIDHAARARRWREAHAAGQKIGVRQVQRRRHESGNVNIGAGADGDAVGIDQKNAPVGLQGAEDGRWIHAADPVEHRADLRLLDKAGDLAAGNRERLPVDHRARRIGDGQRAALGGKCGLTVCDSRPRGIGQCGVAGETRSHSAGQHGALPSDAFVAVTVSHQHSPGWCISAPLPTCAIR